MERSPSLLMMKSNTRNMRLIFMDVSISAVGEKQKEVHPMENNSRFNYLLEQYPEHMTKEQMYKACHISKKTCRFLLESGVVPCQDSGKKTCRFKINTSDVINYLENREVHPEYYKPPAWYYKRKDHVRPRAFSAKDLLLMRQFYDEALKDLPDVLTVKNVCAFSGYCNTSVVNWCKKGSLRCFIIKTRFYIPKEYLIDFFISWSFIGIAVKSKTHELLNKQIYEYLHSHR